jgi:hypothetical protein
MELGVPETVAQSVQIAWFSSLVYWRKPRNLDRLRYGRRAIIEPQHLGKGGSWLYRKLNRDLPRLKRKCLN